jgi:tetratricopeptide (TPR) repeat protein
MNKWLLISIVSVGFAAGASSATGQTEPEAKQLAVKGHTTFVQVLGGDESRWTEAVRYMEQSRELAPDDTGNLYNLARAYFYDGLTNRNQASLEKAEQTLSKLIALKPEDTRALSFHGSALTVLSGGQDIAKFMQGAQEMKAAIERDPKNINNRIVLALTSTNFPPQALAAMGNYDNLGDLEFVRDAFNGQKFYYAPHADVMMKAFVGEAYLAKGDKAKAQANFEAALAVPPPTEAGALAGRRLIDNAIRARMNGGDKRVASGPALSGCHSCHLNAPDKLLR